VLGGQLGGLATLSATVANGLGAGFPAVCATLPGTPSTLAESAATVACGLASVQGAFDDPETGLVAGGTALAGGVALTADGVDELLSGVRELAEGTRALAEGTEELASGTRELADGAREAADGARELADGADEVPEALVELLGIADRRAAALALDDAAVVRATALAEERARGADGAVAVLTTDADDREVPVIALGAAGGASLALLPVLALAWRRRRRGSA
jgi:putative membrane protein